MLILFQIPAAKIYKNGSKTTPGYFPFSLACVHLHGEPEIPVRKNQVVRPILLRELQKIKYGLWFAAMKFVLLFWVCSADLDILCSVSFSHHVKFHSFVFMQKIFSAGMFLFHCTPGLRLRAGIYKRYWLKGRSRCLNIGDVFLLRF